MRLKWSVLKRQLSSQTKSNYFVTTPIYYVNANPHIGHLYSSLIADAAARWQQLLSNGASVKFSTGTDEHGSKIQLAASLNKATPSEYCDHISAKYLELASHFHINYTDFVRTSNDVHKNTVAKFWEKLHNNGHIYSAKYEGWYCVSDETFLRDTQLKEVATNDGSKVLVSAESSHPVEWTEEENYMFKLTSFKSDLRYWLKKDDVVKPKKFQKLLMDLLDREDFDDISISRPTSRVHWGIKVPGDDTQTIYVWLDALVNYLTAAGYDRSECDFRKVWPPDLQVIGKDILKFHGVYWPAFLMAADLEPPRALLCHSHWTVDGEKMSKSKNNVVCPLDRSRIYTSDGLRYFLLREGVAHSDGNYSDTKLIRILNSELADTLGNLLSRCTGVALNTNQVFPEIEPTVFQSVSSLDVTRKLIENVTALPGTCKIHYEELNFYKVVDSVISTLHSANLFFESLKPWELKKKPECSKELDVVLHLTLETLRVSAVLLKPIIPNLAESLLNKIRVPESERFFNNLSELSWRNSNFQTRKLSPEKLVLFKRILLGDEKKKSVKSS